LFRHTLETGEPHFSPERIEERIDRGVKEYYEWRIDRIPLPHGDFGVVCYFRDISAQVHAREAVEALNAQLTFELSVMAGMQQVLKTREEELRRANRDLEQFAHSASHDLQEPLRTVKSTASWFRSDMATGSMPKLWNLSNSLEAAQTGWKRSCGICLHIRARPGSTNPPRHRAQQIPSVPFLPT
jgi:signal transduction histidine kinase